MLKSKFLRHPSGCLLEPIARKESKMAKEKEKMKRYVVVPRTNDGYKELYAKASAKTVMFGQPVALTEMELASLKNQKESVMSQGPQTPYDLARERGISIDKAVEMLDQMGNTSTPDQMTWLPRYEVHEV